jgi:choline-sulfatase
MFGKGCFYDPSIKVPMIWAPLGERVTGVDMAAGTDVNAPVSLLDIAPTLLNLTAAPDLPVMDGEDLAPLLAGREDEEWAMRPVLAEMELMLLGRPACRMVRRDRFKYVYYHNERSQLFDVKADPEERHDLARDPEYAEVCKDLEALALDGWDPEEITRDYERCMADLRYVTEWGREVGMGRLELWDQAAYGSPRKE